MIRVPADIARRTGLCGAGLQPLSVSRRSDQVLAGTRPTLSALSPGVFRSRPWRRWLAVQRPEIYPASLQRVSPDPSSQAPDLSFLGGMS